MAKVYKPIPYDPDFKKWIDQQWKQAKIERDLAYLEQLDKMKGKNHENK